MVAVRALLAAGPNHLGGAQPLPVAAADTLPPLLHTQVFHGGFFFCFCGVFLFFALARFFYVLAVVRARGRAFFLLSTICQPTRNCPQPLVAWRLPRQMQPDSDNNNSNTGNNTNTNNDNKTTTIFGPDTLPFPPPHFCSFLFPPVSPSRCLFRPRPRPRPQPPSQPPVPHLRPRPLSPSPSPVHAPHPRLRSRDVALRFGADAERAGCQSCGKRPPRCRLPAAHVQRRCVPRVAPGRGDRCPRRRHGEVRCARAANYCLLTLLVPMCVNSCKITDRYGSRILVCAGAGSRLFFATPV